MSSDDNLEVEELENVPLVRMADVQPDRSVEYVLESEKSDNCDDEGEGSYQCVMDDEDSNIGSMVSIKSEDVVCDDAELIVPEVLDTTDDILQKPPKPEPELPKTPKSWPTLEILPGGVINLVDKEPPSEPLIDDDTNTDGTGMMYACAKCPQSYNYLVSLVKHVRWHEDEARKLKIQQLAKLKPKENERIIFIKNMQKKKIVSKPKVHRVPKKS